MVSRVRRAAMLLVVAVLLLSHLQSGGPRQLRALLAPGLASAASASGGPLFQQVPRSSGGLLRSSVLVSGTSSGDRWVWDNFTLEGEANISEIRWTGAYDPASKGSGGPVAGFTIAFYGSSPLVNEPDLSALLFKYDVPGNAGQTPWQEIAGVQLYDYAFTLPTPFAAAGQVRYWVQIEALQAGSLPDWGLAASDGVDAYHFRRTGGAVNVYQRAPGDASFALYGQSESASRLYIPLAFHD